MEFRESIPQSTDDTVFLLKLVSQIEFLYAIESTVAEIYREGEGPNR
jgi:hypothetical protein